MTSSTSSLGSPGSDAPTNDRSAKADGPAPGRSPRRWVPRYRPRRADVVAMLIPTVIYAVMGWEKRWITDDGLIFTRAARMIATGHGPVYSIGERAETSTSTLWQWILALVDVVSPFDLTRQQVYLGLILSVTGLWIGLNATRRALRTLGTRRYLLPFGALVFVCVPSVWDFVTAGMETGLIVFWFGLSWSLLVSVWQRLEGGVSRRRVLTAAFVFGLGPLVRPDLGLTMVVLLASLVVLTRARWGRGILILVAAGFLPAAYQVFRMGYYGLIFPMPALTKEAGESLWHRGWQYLTDYVRPYYLWIPLALFVVLIGVLFAQRRARGLSRPSNRTLVLLLTPVVCALAQTVYILKVGGDFMHGRMWMPVLLMLMLPIALAPVDRLTTPVIACVAAWAVFCSFTIRTGIVTTPSPIKGSNQVWNERDEYVHWTQRQNPTTAADHARTLPSVVAQVREAEATGQRLLIIDPNYAIPGVPPLPNLPLRKDLPYRVAVVIGRLGVGGVVTPIDGGLVDDVWGLSNTIGAHITPTLHAAAGHEKLLPVAWNIALYADPSGDALVPPGWATPQEIAAARHTLTCGPVKELLDSVTQPMSFSRFWDNLTGAYDRTNLRIPSDPIQAEQKFCGAHG